MYVYIYILSNILKYRICGIKSNYQIWKVAEKTNPYNGEKNYSMEAETFDVNVAINKQVV